MNIMPTINATNLPEEFIIETEIYPVAKSDEMPIPIDGTFSIEDGKFKMEGYAGYGGSKHSLNTKATLEIPLEDVGFWFDTFFFNTLNDAQVKTLEDHGWEVGK